MSFYDSFAHVTYTTSLCCLLSCVSYLPPATRPSSLKGWERRVWTPEECLAELAACVAEVWDLSRRAREGGGADALGSYVFDKDFR